MTATVNPSKLTFDNMRSRTPRNMDRVFFRIPGDLMGRMAIVRGPTVAGEGSLAAV